MASEPTWYSGRDQLVAAWAPILHGPDAAEFTFVLTGANRQPAAAQYIRPRGTEGEFRAFALTVARIENGVVAELSVFAPDLFEAFGLPRTL
jgi:RNA polymerase sigma-70 factor (ECF subfamily)